MGPILGVFALIPPFWALFDQSTSTWVLQGAKMEAITLSGGWLLGLVLIAGAALMALAIWWRGDALKWGVVGVSALAALAWLLMVVLPATTSAAASPSCRPSLMCGNARAARAVSARGSSRRSG